MTRWRVLLARLSEIVRGRRLDDDLRAEVQHHLDSLTDEFVRRGLAPAEARAMAHREFGGVDQATEAVRDARGVRWLEVLWRDTRHAVRLLRKSPGFTVAAVITLALGVGANTAIFSLVDAVMLRPLPYVEPRDLVAIWELPSAPVERLAGTPRIAVAPANLADYRRARSFSTLAAFASVGRNLTGAGTPERLFGEAVTVEYFATLGATPAIGRAFRPEEHQPGGGQVVVLADGLWRQRFGADPAVLGRTITLDQRPYEVVGVMAPDFRAITAFRQPDAGRFWVPLAFDAELLANRQDHEVEVVARLAPGVSIETARSELQSVAAALAASLPAGQASGADLAPLNGDLVREVSAILLALVAAVALILFIACLNVANLLIVRSIARQREIAVRLALGASRARIVGELITQSLVLSAMGSAVGAALALAMVQGLVALAPAAIPHLDRVAIDGRVLAFTALTSIVVGLVFGLLPVRQIALSRPADALKLTERAVSGAWVWRWRSAAMVAEVALSLALLIGAGLMIRSLIAIADVDLGFDPEGVIAANITLPESRYATAEARYTFFESLSARVSALPGVRSVAYGNRLPLRGNWTSGFQIEPRAGVAGETGLSTGFQAVNPEYFRMFGLAARRGRLLAATDRKGAEPVAVVSENFAARFLGGATPIGHRLRRFEQAPWITIVGVVPNIRREGKLAAESPQVYLAAAQTDLYPLRLTDLAVRGDVDPAILAPQILAAVWAIDPDQTVTNVRTLDEVLALKIADRRFQAFLFGLFAGLAALLATIGVYSVASYAVAQRRPEIGLRMALGATGRHIMRWLVGQMARLVLTGAAIGIALSIALSHLVRGLLFQVTPTDAPTYAGAALLLSAVAIGTSALVVRAAMKTGTGLFSTDRAS
jgi:putative ABC transport system permease protein